MKNSCLNSVFGHTLNLGLILAAVSSQGVTMEELRRIPNLTPQKFARRFSEFLYEHNPETQTPATFLARETGDCDDFTLVASIIFTEKGYHPRLIEVQMNKLTHSICYFPETHSYIDYSDRSYLFTATASDGTLRDIASKVAKTLRCDWTSVAEFSFADGIKERIAHEEKSRAMAHAP